MMAGKDDLIRCKNCRWWMYAPDIYERKCCKHGEIVSRMGNETDRSFVFIPRDLLDAADEISLITQPDFACIHGERK